MTEKKNPEERAKKRSRASGKAKAAAAGAAAVGAGAAVKYAKKSPVSMLIIVLCLIAGIILGCFFAVKTTQYAMNGEDYVEVEMYSSYEERGAVLQVLGKDYSDEIAVSYFYREDISHDEVACNSVDTSVAGFYYAVYSCDMVLYKNVKLIRTIEVVRVEDDG